MKTHMNNNKNIKKIFIFCLYNVITLSASIAGCCEKNDLNIILNKSREKLPLPNNIEMSALFSYINSPATNPQLDPQIINDNSEKENFNNIQSAISAFTRVEKRKTDADQTLTNKIQKLENAGYTKLNFSSIDTDEKYDAEAFKLPDGKKTLVIIHCSECDKIMTGALTTARNNLAIHREITHGIEYHRRSKNKIKNSNPQNDEPLKLEFLSINTQKQYDNMALQLPKKKQTFVSISCPNCDSTSDGKLSQVRPRIRNHIKKFHPNFPLG